MASDPRYCMDPGKAILAGVGVSFCIEFLQLPFFDRVSDIDDLILNSLGYLMGYGIYAAAKQICRHRQTHKGDHA